MKYPLAIINEDKNIFDTLKQKYSVINQQNIKDKISNQLTDWHKKIVKKLNLTNPFYDNQKAFENAQNELSRNKHDLESIKKDFINYKALEDLESINIDTKFWDKEIESLKNRTIKLKNKPKKSKLKVIKKVKLDNQDKISSDEKICRTLLQNKWQKSLDEEYLKWELQEIEKYRKELLHKLEEWLKLVQEMDNLLSQLSLDNGVLFDLSKQSSANQNK